MKTSEGNSSANGSSEPRIPRRRSFPVGSILTALIEEIAADEHRTPEDVHTEALRRGLTAMALERNLGKLEHRVLRDVLEYIHANIGAMEANEVGEHFGVEWPPPEPPGVTE